MVNGSEVDGLSQFLADQVYEKRVSCIGVFKLAQCCPSLGKPESLELGQRFCMALTSRQQGHF